MRVAEKAGPFVLQRRLDPLDPRPRDAGRVAVVERGRDLLGEQPLELDRVAVVLRAVVVVHVAGQRPAVHPVERLGPPAVEHAELQPAVDRRLHAARAARLQRRAREVEPDVAAAHHARRAGEVVVVEVDDAGAGVRRPLVREQVLHHALALVVARVRLAGEDELHGAVAGEDAQGAVGVAHEQVEALVGREPAREADRERLGVERLGGRLGVERGSSRPSRSACSSRARTPRTRRAARCAPPTAPRPGCRPPAPRSPGRPGARASPRRGGGRAAGASARRSTSGGARRW